VCSAPARRRRPPLRRVAGPRLLRPRPTDFTGTPTTDTDPSSTGSDPAAIAAAASSSAAGSKLKGADKCAALPEGPKKDKCNLKQKYKAGTLTPDEAKQLFGDKMNKELKAKFSLPPGFEELRKKARTGTLAATQRMAWTRALKAYKEAKKRHRLEKCTKTGKSEAECTAELAAKKAKSKAKHAAAKAACLASGKSKEECKAQLKAERATKKGNKKGDITRRMQQCRLTGKSEADCLSEAKRERKADRKAAKAKA
jgi:hypothetical protein